MEQLHQFVLWILSYFPFEIKQNINGFYFYLQDLIGKPYLDYILIVMPGFFILYGIIGHSLKKLDFFYSYFDVFFSIVPFITCALSLFFKREYFDYTLYFLLFSQVIIVFSSIRANGFFQGIMSFFAKLFFSIIWGPLSISWFVVFLAMAIIPGKRKKYERKARYRKRQGEESAMLIGFSSILLSLGISLLCRNRDFSLPKNKYMDNKYLDERVSNEGN